MARQSYEKKGKDLFSKLGRTIMSGAETLMQETKELTRVGKLKMELLALENERGRRFEEIGRLAHTLYKEGADFEELKQPLAGIDELEAKIDAKYEEIEKIPEEEVEVEVPVAEPEDVEESIDITPTPPSDELVLHYCPQCGAQTEEDDKFCSNCGNPLEG